MNAEQQFAQHVKAIDAELHSRARLIEDYQRKDYAHERLIGKLRALLRDDNLDDARELVEAEYDAIHGPRD